MGGGTRYRGRGSADALAVSVQFIFSTRSLSGPASDFCHRVSSFNPIGFRERARPSTEASRPSSASRRWDIWTGAWNFDELAGSCRRGAAPRPPAKVLNAGVPCPPRPAHIPCHLEMKTLT